MVSAIISQLPSATASACETYSSFKLFFHLFLHASFRRFLLWANTFNVLHLSGHSMSVFFRCRTSTMGQMNEILHAFCCSILDQQPLSPKQQPGYRVSMP